MRCASILVVLFAAFLANSIVSRADLGDTFNQSTIRYGAPISHKGAIYFFKKESLEIDEVFNRGIVFYEVVWKPDRSALSIIEQEAVLQENAKSEKWELSKRGTWLRDDGAFARYIPTLATESPCNCLILGQKR